MSVRILIVDDDPNIRLMIHDRLERLGYRIFQAGSCTEMHQLVEKYHFDLMLLDLQLPDGDGLDMLDEMREHLGSMEVIMISAYGTITKAVEGMRRGIFDFIAKPFDLLDMETRIKKALDYQALKREAEVFRSGHSSERERLVIGKSQEMKKCIEVCYQVAETDTTVLLLGETGTGKGVLANYIHEKSSRADHPFVVISCTNFSEHLVEDELFGHEQGAFTGAIKYRPGRVELAEGGTLFFDEIGELSKDLQAKLLRFLEKRAFTRVGGNKEMEADVRLMAASNRDLAQEVKKGNFREDLYYRLNVCPIILPPLRNRREDIPEMVEFFIKEMPVQNSRKEISFRKDALDVLKKYHWPGNVRELRNVLERATILSKDGIIAKEHLFPLDDSCQSPVEIGDYKKRMTDFEKKIVLSALEATGWNQTEAAKKLKLNRTQFIRIMDRHGLKPVRIIDPTNP